MNDEQADVLLREWARSQVAAAPTVDVPITPGHGRSRRRAWLAIAAAVVTVLGIGAGLTVFRGDPVRHDRTLGHATVDHLVYSGRAGEAVVHDGDLVTVQAHVVGVPGGEVRACYGIVATDQVIPTQGQRHQPFATCGQSVRLTGVDLDKLAHAKTVDGVWSGDATLVGTFSNGSIAVTEQSRPAAAKLHSYDTVPCRSPSAGWARAGEADARERAATAYRRAHPGSIVEIAFLNPSPRRQLLYVITDGNPAPVRAALDVGRNDLCVVRSKYTGAEFAHSRAVLLGAMDRRGDLTSLTAAGGFGLGPDKQPIAPIEVAMMSESLARLVDAQPAGLVQADVWILPADR